METDLRLYLACQYSVNIPRCGWLSELPSLLERVTPEKRQQATKITRGLMARLGGSGSSGLRISDSNQFHTFSRRICGFAHLNPTNSRMIKTTSTMLAVISIATVVPLYSRAS